MYLGDEKNIDLIKSSLEIRPVPSGANLHILIPYDEGVFYNTNGDREENIVSATQTYLDLIYERGRGEEAAEAILQSVIRRKWQ